MGEPKLDPDLLSELTSDIPVYNAGCGVGRSLSSMTDETTAATLRHALTLPEARTIKLVEAFRRLGFSVDESTIRRHRRNQCKCQALGL